jgi:hypothetical protein
MSLLDYNEFKWRTMTPAINQIQAAPMMLQDLIFKARRTNASDHIDVDVIVGNKKIAPFVSPVEGGVVIDKLGRETRSVIAPRIRLKKPFNAQELLTVRASGMAGYATGYGDIARYRQEKVGLELADLRAKIDYTLEWMCSQAMAGTITDPDGKFAVTYGIPATHKPTRLTTTRWSQSTGEIMNDIDEWANLIINAIGVGPAIGICGKNTVSAIRGSTKIQTILNTTSGQNAGALGWKASSNFLGNLNGIDLYRYGSQYVDAAGVTQNFIPDDYFIMVAPQARFTIEYGQILDLEAEAQIVGQYFSKSWIEKDPTVMWILAESRPLPVLWQPEAVVYAKVC